MNSFFTQDAETIQTKSYYGKNTLVQTLLLVLFIFGAAYLVLICETKDAYASERQSLSTAFGVTREELIAWLTLHEQDNYYLGTPYRSSDWRSPTGDINHWGAASDGRSAGMNCTGFVWHALCAAHEWKDNIANRMPALQGWADFIKNQNSLSFFYDSKEAMLADGKLEKGDIIWMFDQGAGGMEAISSSHHVGIFWGETPSEDKLWHSVADDSITRSGSNRISEIHGKAASILYVLVKTEPTGGHLELLKASSDSAISANHACYSLENAEYDIFNAEGTWISNLVTNKDGWAKSALLSVGRYKIKEKKAPAGYFLDAAEYWVEVLPGQTVRVNHEASGLVQEQPFSYQISLFLEKVDSGTGKNETQGRASLANAEFKVNYYDNYYSDTDTAWIQEVEPTRSWKIKTDEQGKAFLKESYKLSGDNFYYDKSGVVVLPLGTITIQEVKAPLGYVLDDQNIQIQQIQYNKELNSIIAYKVPLIKEQVIRGDLAFVKIEDKTMKRLADVPFEIKSNTTGEAHVIITDKNGYFNTSTQWNPHSQNTNRGESSADGIWFGLASDGSFVDVEDTLGALPYDSYTIRELPCVANKDKILSTFEVVIERDMTTVNLGTLTNELEPPLDPPPVEDEKPAMPKTSDAPTPIVPLLIGLACIAGVSLLVIIKKRNRKDYQQFPTE